MTRNLIHKNRFAAAFAALTENYSRVQSDADDLDGVMVVDLNNPAITVNMKGRKLGRYCEHDDTDRSETIYTIRISE